MILSGKEIQRELGKRIFIEPFDPSRLNPNSYNLTLHDELLVYDSPVLDMKKPNPAHTIQGDYEPCRSGKYQNNQGIQPSLLYRDFEP